MKKNNYIVYGLISIAVFAFAFFQIDQGTILEQRYAIQLLFIFVGLLILCIGVIFSVDFFRKTKVRTIYVGESFFTNSEKGSKAYSGTEQLVSLMQETLLTLKYDFSRQELSKQAKPLSFVVRTKRFSPDTWKGDLITLHDASIYSFHDSYELSRLINQVRAVHS